MNADFDNCPFCGRKILKGAMKCPVCGKILKTPEEQAAAIQKLRESRKKYDMIRLIKLVTSLIAIGIILYFFSDRIIEFIRNLLGK